MNWLDRVRAGLREHEDARDEVVGGETAASPEADLPAKPASPAPRHPEAIGPFQVLRVLGQGAMGVVYAARSERLDREVALKVLKLERVDTPELVERFEIEARAAARLRHPNIVGIHEVGAHREDDGAVRRYLVMELVQGRSLAARVKDEGPLPPRDAATIAERLARALAYAHARWILHRDIKPANVLLADAGGEPLLTDFGMAKVLDAPGGAPSPTVSGQIMGTPAYMPPEQARGEHGRVDRRSDVYALGATLYEMLTGAPPWSASSVMGVLAKVTSFEPVSPPSRLRPGLDPDLETICLRCLEKDPGDRYLTADDLAADLARWLADEPIAARRPTLRARGRKWLRRNRALARALGVVLAAALVVAGAATLGFVRRLDDERARADAAAREASRQAERARARADVAKDALRVLIFEVRDELAHVPGERVRQVRSDLLEHALLALEQLRDAELAEGARLEAAEAQRQIGDLRLVRADEGLAPAAEAFERAVALGRAAVAAASDDAGSDAADEARARHDLGESLRRLADVRRDLGQLDQAEALAREAHDHALAAGQPLLAASTLRQLALVARARDDLPGAAERLARAAALARSAPPDDGRDACLAEVLDEHANVLSHVGDLTAARAVLEEALVLARRRRAADDASPGLSFVLSELLAKQGELARALGAIDEAVATVRERLAQDPTQAVLRGQLPQFLVQRALVRRQVGEVDAAADDLVEAVSLLRALVSEQPDDRSRADDLTSALSTLAQSQLERGEATLAAAAAAEAVERYRAREAPPPADLGLALARLSRARRELGDHARALELAREVVDLRRGLVASGGARERAHAGLADATESRASVGPTTREAGLRSRTTHHTDGGARERARAGLDDATGRASDGMSTREAGERSRTMHHTDVRADRRDRQALLAGLHELGDLLLLQAHGDEGRAAMAEALALARALRAEDPTNVEHHHNLVGALQAAAKVGAAPPAETFEEALVEARALVARDPARVASRHWLGIVANQLAALRLAGGDVEGAEAAAALALGTFRALAADAGAPGDRRDLAVSLCLLGEAREAASDVDGALGRYAESIGVLRELAAEHPTFRRDLAVSLERASRLRLVSGDVAGGGEGYAECLALRRALFEANPTNLLARRDVSSALVGVAQVRGLEGDEDAALVLWREAVENHRALVAAAPQYAAELDEITEALRITEREVRRRELLRGALAPTTPDDHLALGYAAAERGEHAAAADHLARALDDEAVRADLRGGHLYNGACAAALASVAASDEAASAALRQRALEWLRDDARRRRELVAQAPPAQREQADEWLRRHTEHARQDPDLASLRGPDLDAIHPPP